MFDVDRIIDEIGKFGITIGQFDDNLIKKLKDIVDEVGVACACGCHNNRALALTHCERCIRKYFSDLRNEYVKIIGHLSSVVQMIALSLHLESRLKHIVCQNDSEHGDEDCPVCRVAEQLEGQRLELAEKASLSIQDLYDIKVEL